MLRRSINGVFIILTVVLLALSGSNAYGQKGGSTSTDSAGAAGASGAAGVNVPGKGDVGPAGAGPDSNRREPKSPWERAARLDESFYPGPPRRGDDILPPPQPKKKEPVKRPTVEPPGPIPNIVPPMARPGTADDILPPPEPKKKEPVKRPTVEPPGPIPNIVPPPGNPRVVVTDKYPKAS